jgi:diguanylate cyclase (GGDEF)-like protein
VAHDELDLSLDLLAGLLRTWARNPIELPLREAEIIAAELEAWAAHLLNGSPPPGSKARGKLKERDWPGAQQFIARLRRDEATAVRGAASDFRATLQALVTKVREAIEEERELDSTVALQLDRLRAAAEGNDLQALREAATSAADAVSTVLDAHRTRLAEQEQQMSSRLLAIGEKLTAAEQLAEEDPLTGLVNRRGFDAELAKAVELGAQFKMVSALLLIDVDHFKSVNDTFGHQAGDAALKSISNTLSRTFPRRSDCVARYGGDEFAVILRDVRSGEAEPLARRFLEALRSLVVHPLESEIRISASIGIAELKAGESSASWVARADAGVYAAKSGGRDRAALTP